MIKKLVKYGNSHALVLDKALLEILNISDTTQLKLSTDGKGLIITPLQQPTPQPVSVTEEETTRHYAQTLFEKEKDKWERLAQAPKEALLELHFVCNEFMNAFDEKYNFRKRLQDMMESTAFKAKHAELDQRARTENMPTEQYFKEYIALQQSFLPDIPFDEYQAVVREHEKKFEAKYPLNNPK